MTREKFLEKATKDLKKKGNLQGVNTKLKSNKFKKK